MFTSETFSGIFFLFSYRQPEWKLPSVSMPEVPPKVTGYGKIWLDIVTNIMLPLIDEGTDLVSGVRYFM